VTILTISCAEVNATTRVLVRAGRTPPPCPDLSVLSLEAVDVEGVER
jgi:hypothetical protein